MKKPSICMHEIYVFFWAEPPQNTRKRFFVYKLQISCCKLQAMTLPELQLSIAMLNIVPYINHYKNFIETKKIFSKICVLAESDFFLLFFIIKIKVTDQS